MRGDGDVPDVAAGAAVPHHDVADVGGAEEVAVHVDGDVARARVQAVPGVVLKGRGRKRISTLRMVIFLYT